MAAERTGARRKRESRVASGARLDLRLGPEDRPVHQSTGRAPVHVHGAAAPVLPAPHPPIPLFPEPDDTAPSADAAPRRKAPARRKSAADESRAAPSPRKRPAGRRTGRSGGGGRRTPRPGLIRRLTYWTCVAGLWVVIAAVGWIAWVAAHLPAIQDLKVPKRPPSVQILARGGAPLATRGEMGGAAVPLAELPRHLPQAFIAIEDRRFENHFGVDVIGVARAAVANVLRRGVAQGGSTLTQQLAKNLFLTQERTFERKVQELLLALWLERTYSKNEIIELYMNRVYFGAGAYGVEAAAQRYFGKSARAVTVAEAALLAGLVRAPSRLAPTRNPDGARRRAAVVLGAMRDAGFIAPEVERAALARPGQVARSHGAGSTNYVADWVMDVLDDLIGPFENDLVVETTIDARLQAAAERALTEELAQRGDRAGVAQGALVSVTPEGAVRALVGGRNYAESQFNRAIAARRQPGSAFKPFVYLAALERGLTPDTLREDRPVNIRGWRPENFSRDYQGTVPLSRALAQSLNTVAVRLALEVSPKSVVQVAHRLGVASTLAPNASIALGTSEVSVLEMATAFMPFANNGLSMIPHVVTRIRAADGRVIYRRQNASLGRIVSQRNVAMMNAMLQEAVTSGTGRNVDLGGRPAAGKTGTSQDFRDAWFVGYTAQLVTAVWLGNDDASSTKKVSGGTLPVGVWNRYMRAAHQGLPVADLPGLGRPPMPAPLPAPGQIASGRGGPVPPGGVETQRRQPQPTSLDRWLMDTVFGRR